MAVVKIIMLAFYTAGKTRKASVFSERRKIFVAAGQDFVSVALMAHIENYRILGAVKNPVKGNSKLNNTKVAGKMPAVFCHGLDYPLSYFLTKPRKLFFRNFF